MHKLPFSGEYWEELFDGRTFMYEEDFARLLGEVPPQEWIDDYPWEFMEQVARVVLSGFQLFDEQVHFNRNNLTLFWKTVKQLVEHGLTTQEDLGNRFPLLQDVFQDNQHAFRYFYLRTQERRFQKGQDLTENQVRLFFLELNIYGHDPASSYLNESLLSYLRSTPELLSEYCVKAVLEKSKGGRLLLEKFG